MPTSTRARLPLVAFLLAFACATPPPAERSAASPRAAETAAAPSSAAAPAPAPAAPAVAAPAPAGKSAALVVPDAPSGADADRIAQLSRKARPLVDAFLNSEALFTRDGKQVVLVSNRDGLPQLYVADAARPESPARRLFESKERVTLDMAGWQAAAQGEGVVRCGEWTETRIISPSRSRSSGELESNCLSTLERTIHRRAHSRDGPVPPRSALTGTRPAITRRP